MKRIALIMAGGSGERFWPLSRPERPKQLLALTSSGRALLDETVSRVAPVLGAENVFIVTSKQLLEPIQEQLPRLASQLIDEPSKKNSAGAIVWGMGVIAGLLGEEDLSFAVLPSDHQVHPLIKFRERVADALRIAETEKKLVTIGISPNRPETGYGYIHSGEQLDDGVSRIDSFIEKPPREVAEQLVARPRTLWNSGMFFWRFDVLLEQLQSHSPIHANALRAIISEVRAGSSEGAQKAFEQLPSISIDHALMEHSKEAVVVRGDFEWDDLGAWDSLSRILPLDPSGNALAGRSACHDSSDCVVVNAGEHQTVQVLGVHDLVVVVTEDAVLVCPKDRAQDVRRFAR